MAYISINNFKFGLDSRRSELSSIQGTLLEAMDGHITQGGEFEKRKAFVKLNNIAIPVGTFGLEVTSTGLVVFGSAAPTGVLVAGTTLYTIPGYAGVYYQQLVHPSSLFGNGSPPALTAVLCSTSFGGKTWAAGKFADGSVCCYSDGVSIPGFYNGLVLTGANSNQQLAEQLAAYAGTIPGFTVGPVTQNGSAYYFDLSSSSGLAYSLVVDENAGNTGTGVIRANNINATVNGTAGNSSSTSFVVVGGSFYNGTGTSGITSIQVFDQASNTWIEILGVPVYFTSGQDVTDFAANVAGQIDTYISGLNVSALATSNTVTIDFDVSYGASPNGDNVRITSVGDTCIDNTVFSFAGVASLPSGTQCNSIKVPNQTNLVPNGAAYSAGSYVLSSHATFVNGTSYLWTPKANDASLTCGATTLTTAGIFTFATGNTVTLTGTGSSTITATVLTMIDILGSTVTSGTVLSTWLASIASTSRAFCIANSLPYAAFATSNMLDVSRKSIDTSLPFGGKATISVTSGVNVTDGSSGNSNTPAPLRASIATPTLTLNPNGNTGTFSKQVSVVVSGGASPYTFTWAPTGTVQGSLLGLTNIAALTINIPDDPASANQVTFTGVVKLAGKNALTQPYNCVVVDSLGVSTVASITVTLLY